MKAKFIFFSMGLIFSVETIAQGNLIGNGSFEFVNSHPFWIIPTINDGHLLGVSNPANYTPDYFNGIDPASINYQLGVPSNVRGYQQARTGNAYIGLDLWQIDVLGRDYIQIRLESTLISNHHYQFECFLSRAENFRYATSDFGIYFSIDSISMPAVEVLPFDPQIENPKENYLTDTANWMPVTGTYLAQGGEKYIILGNFTDSLTIPDTLYQYYGNATNYYDWAYYYIDDVSLIDLDSALSIEENQATLQSLQVYPNPAQNSIFVQHGDNYQTIEIYQSSGQVLLIKELTTKGNEVIDVSNLPNGIYLLRLTGDFSSICKRFTISR